MDLAAVADGALAFSRKQGSRPARARCRTVDAAECTPLANGRCAETRGLRLAFSSVRISQGWYRKGLGSNQQGAASRKLLL
jgi:hypothetical protein